MLTITMPQHEVICCPKPCLSVHVKSLLIFYKKPYLHKVTPKQGQKWKIPWSKYMNGVLTRVLELDSYPKILEKFSRILEL
jgi:hypothetical protein